MRLATGLFAASVLLSPAASAQSGDEIVWLDNYPAALRLARETGKPIFLEYRCEP